MGVNDGSAVYVTVTNELPHSLNTPTVFSTPARNNTSTVDNLNKKFNPWYAFALLNEQNKQNEDSEENTQNRFNLIYHELKPSIVDYLKSEGIIKAQEGGSMSRNEALDKAMETHGYSDRSTARFAYANAKNALRKQGLRGRALREQARRMIAGDTTGFSSEETKPVQNGVNSKEVKPIDNENLNLQNLIMANLIAKEPISVNSEIVGLPDFNEIPNPKFTVERGKYKEVNTPENTNENFEQNVRNGWLNWYLGLSNSANTAVPTSDIATDTYNYQYPSTDFLSTEPVQTLKWRPYWKQGGVLKGQSGEVIPEINKLYSEKNTMIKGPSIGQSLLGTKRPWISQTVYFNPFSEKNDTVYNGKHINAFDTMLNDDVLKINYETLPESIKKKLANIIDTDYSEYNTNRGSYPNNYYEKTIDVKRR